jgi:hypothetical protein
MHELDRFNGMVIVTTNLFENYGPTLLRRIQRQIKFRSPDASMKAWILCVTMVSIVRHEASVT